MASRLVRPQPDVPDVPYFSLDLHASSDPDTVEVLLTGDVDGVTVGHLDDGLEWVVQHMPQRRVVIDLAAVTRLEPCGAEALAGVGARLRTTDRVLALRAAGAGVEEALRTVGLTGAVPA